jgi:hypothetical protein
LPNQIFDISRPAVSAATIQKSVKEIFPQKQKGQTQKRTQFGFLNYFKSLQTLCKNAEIVQARLLKTRNLTFSAKIIITDGPVW